jgi:hypothetical protein
MLTPKENLLNAIFRRNPEWVPYDLESVLWLYPPYIERPARAGRDSFGVLWDFDPAAEGGTYPAANGHTLHDLADWRAQITIPDVAAMDWSQVTLGWGYGGELARLGEIDRENRLVCGIVEFGLFERSYLLLGMQEALMNYVTAPQEMDALLSALADFKIALISKFYEIARPDMIWFGDDWGTQQNLFLRPPVWRALIKPHLRRVYDCMKARRLIINQHSCGKIEAIFADIVELGTDIWNPCQPCNDLARLKKGYGDRIAFAGGIDSQFILNRPGVTPAEVRAEVRRRIEEMAAGGGYIAAPSHSVPYRPEILHAMEDEIHTYGRLYYNQG